jgi:hypothetical protein
MALVGKYKSGFTGEVPKEFSKPDAFTIKPAYATEGAVREAYGYNSQKSHPTPTDPHKS